MVCLAMPSPLNTPTNERQLVGSELWSLKTPEAEMSGLELSAHSVDAIDSSDTSSHHMSSKSIPLMATISDHNNQSVATNGWQ